MDKTLFLYTQTATHAGTGAGLGAVDLPIQREVTTRYPTIQGTGVKGALRHQFTLGEDHADTLAIFGPKTDNASEHAGAVIVGDAHILAFPVRSLKGVMAWITCRDVLARFQRDCKAAASAKDNNGKAIPLPQEPKIIPNNETEALPAFNSTVINASHANGIDGGTILLEEYAYKAVSNANVAKWAEWIAANALPSTPAVYKEYYQPAFTQRLIVVRNDDFRDFALYATQVVTRIKVERATKTVANGQLFTQELLPADTLFYIPVAVMKERTKNNNPRSDADLAKLLVNNTPPQIQIGGDETTGRGIVALHWGA